MDSPSNKEDILGNNNSAMSKNKAIFVMTLILSANVIIKKIMMVKMYNYGAFVCVSQALRNVVLSCALLVFVKLSGLHSKHDKPFELKDLNPMNIPWKYYLSVGLLDSITINPTYFAYAYLPGRLVILVQQGLIPLNSFVYFKSLSNKFSKIGSIMIFLGIAFIFVAIGINPFPVTSCTPINEDAGTTCDYCLDIGDNEEECLLGTNSDICEFGESSITSMSTFFQWSAILLLTCIPHFFSIHQKSRDDSPSKSVNNVVNFSITSFVGVGFSVLLSTLLAWIAEPAVLPQNWPSNMSDGNDCYRHEDTIETGCFADDCSRSFLWVNLFMAVNFIYQVAGFQVARHPDADNITLVSLTLTVPLCTVFFMIPGFPTVEHEMSWHNFPSLILIIVGLGLYRKGVLKQNQDNEQEGEVEEGATDRREQFKRSKRQNSVFFHAM